MSQKFEPLEYGRYYHIYNRAIGEENLFRHHENYEYFLRLYDKYINPVAETFAWVLLPAHFHLLVRIKEEEEIGYLPRKNKPLPGSKTPGRVGKVSTPPEVENPGGGYLKNRLARSS